MVRQAQLLRSQAMIHLINANVTICPWGRGSGKTSGGIGPRVLHLSEVMPRAQVLLMADEYKRLHEVTLPGLKAFLQSELGLIEEVDYVSHRKPPDNWPKPLFVPDDYDHVTTFSSGFSLCEVAMKITGSAAGFNAQAAIGDEWKYVDPKKFKAEVKPAIRGARKYYGELPEFQSVWLFSDKWPNKGADIRWMLDQRKEVNQDSVDIIYALQLEILRLKKEMEEVSSNEAIYKRKNLIEHYESIANELRRDLVYVVEASSYENKENLGDKFFRDLRRDLTPYEFRVAIENEDPDKSMEPFYPSFNEMNLYKSNADWDPNKPLIIALDYQHNITPVVTAQWGRINGSPYTSLNFIHSLHTLPGDIEDALKVWCDYFQNHAQKLVYYIYDQTAIGRSPRKKTFKDLAYDYLISRGWSVAEIYSGDTPDHDIKHEAIKKQLNVFTDKAIKVNEIRNEFLIKSIYQSDAKLVNGKTKKAKESEKSKTVPPEESTHYSDTFDQILHGVIEMELVPLSDDPGLDITARH